MSFRKGELSSHQIDLYWPHQVITPRLLGSAGMSRWKTLCPRGHDVVIEGEWHHVHCFSDPFEGEAFLQQMAPFGAERFDPRRRQSGHKWATLRPPPANKRRT